MATGLMGHVVHRVKGRDAFNLRVASLKTNCDFGDGFTAEVPAVLALGNPQRGKDAGLCVGIVSSKRVELVYRKFRKTEGDLFGAGWLRPIVTTSDLEELAHLDDRDDTFPA